MPTFRLYPEKAPRKKFRGKRRYFRRIQRKAESFELEVEADSWWDCWHYHADWPGWGNLRWQYRQAHLKALCTVFQKISDARERFPGKFQTWIVLSGENAGHDATFLHTPNANGSPFPFVPLNIEWGSSLPVIDVVKSFLPSFTFQVGLSQWISEEEEGQPKSRTALWIYAEGVGEPLG